MIALDIPTAMFAMGLLLIVLGLMFQGGWKPGEIYAPSRQWAPSAILYGLGMVLVAFRGTWHPLLSVVVANTSLMGGVCLLHRGVSVHVGVPPPDRWYLAVLAGLVAVFLWFTFPHPDVQARIAVMSALVATLVGHALLLLLRHGVLGFTGRLFCSVLGVVAILFGIRALVAGFGTAVGENYLREGGLQAFNVFLSSVSAVVMVAVQYRLEAERVRAALADEAARLRLDRDRLEETVAERTSELSRSNAELEQFAYVASHDLRQPLRMVSSYMTMIERRMGAALQGDLRDFFGFAAEGARRMDAMIVGLLEYSRIGRGGRKAEPVALAEVVADALAYLEPGMAAAGAVAEVPPGLPVVPGDGLELLRLFQNLLSNAVKYVAPGVAPRIRVEWRDEGDVWLVSVSDNGIGIPVDSAERVFGVFQRAVGRDEYEGCGIGLAVCRKIVESHDGSLRVEPAEGGGSRFEVRLPKVVTAPG